MQKLKKLTILFVLAALFFMLGSPSLSVLASPDAVAPNLGAAASFVVLAFSQVTNTGPGFFIGNVGVSPGTSVTGFPPGVVINGAIYTGTDPVAVLAQAAALVAYNFLALQTCITDKTGVELGGTTLTPGVYCFDTSAGLTGDLFLDAQGNSNAVWVFQIGSTLTTASASSVTMINGGDPLRVFWQVGSSATLGTTTRFLGNIIASASVTLDPGATITGRAFALNGKVDMDTNGSPAPISNTTKLYYFYFLPIINR
jgi:hypothetical protein